MNSTYTGPMDLKIGIIGPTDSVTKIIHDAGDNYPDAALIPFIRERVHDSAEGYQEIEETCDGIIFSGIGVECSVRDHFEIAKEYETIARGGYSIMSTIWAMTRDHVNYERLSIDVVTDQVLHEVINEFDLQFTALFSFPFDRTLTEPVYLERHRELYEAGKIDAIVTGFGFVYATLKAEGLPVYRLYPNTIVIRQSLDLLINHIRTKEIRLAGIAIQIIRIKGMTHDSICKYDDLKQHGELYLKVVEYVRMVQGSLFSLGREEMIIFSTRGALGSPVNQAAFQEIARWSRLQDTGFYSGIGYGSTAYEAERAARQALEHAKTLPASGAYIVDNGELSGPLGEPEELTYQLKVIDKETLEISRKTGIDASYITRITAAMEHSGKNEFEAAGLSDLLGVGERTARRIIKKAVDAGYGEVLGKESVSQRGRPRAIVRLSFTSHQ